jgi:hypothetical protein
MQIINYYKVKIQENIKLVSAFVNSSESEKSKKNEKKEKKKDSS